jgi:ADP-heptose:LPS heptosyltransferase/SAM-dependent methyltransferase
MKVLLKFDHGIGDAAQFTAVLATLAIQRPDWVIDVQTRRGKASLFQPLVNQIHLIGELVPETEYDQVISMNWWEADRSYADSPSSKVERCLREVLEIPPGDHSPYKITTGNECWGKATKYYQEIGAKEKADERRNVVLIHYHGNTSRSKKDLPEDCIRTLCHLILKCFHIPVILDWDGRNGLADNQSIKCPHAHHWLWDGHGVGDGEQIAALIQQAALVVAIDSGPQKIAAALDTPLLAVWTQHHPVHYIQPAEHILNLVPVDHDAHIRAPKASGYTYFKDNYRYKVYSNLRGALMEETYSILFPKEAAITVDPNNLRATKYDECYYLEHRQAGLDYLGYGNWQQRYARWLIEALGLKGKHVIDLGCACGSIVRGFGSEGAVVCGVDISEFMIRLGREHWPDMEPILHVCDAINLHPWDDNTFHLSHSAQSAEHWRPEHVPMILRDIYRVTQPGGWFFCTLDTQELYDRQGRNPDHEDPTHFCIQPMAWWRRQLQEAGWELLDGAELINHPGNYFQHYDWDWWLARKV